MARALGTDDSVTTCECCGKSGLKFTFAIELDDGEIVHYGQICARRNTGKDQRTITSEVKTAKLAAVNAAQREYMASPEYSAERARFEVRPRGLVGLQAAEFVREACDAAMAVRSSIAAKHGVSLWSFSA